MLTGPLTDLIDHRKLANQGANLEGSLSVKRFQRMIEMLTGNDGDVHLKLDFERGESGSTRVTGSVSTDLQFECQNCRENFSQNVSCHILLDIVVSEAAAEKLDSVADVHVSAESLINVVELVEDELLLALPMISRHKDGLCPQNEYVSEMKDKEEPVVETHRPFEKLADQLEQQNKPES